MKKNNLIRKVKQGAAGLLTAAMVLTGVPLGSMSAWASVLQPNYDLQVASDSVGVDGGTTYGSSDTTSYAFGDSSAKYGSDSSVSNFEKNTPGRASKSSFNLAAVIKKVASTDNKKRV